MNIAGEMDDAALIQFADAMGFDSSQSPLILRDLTEGLAELEPKYFADLVLGKELEYRSTIRQAVNKGVISFDPADYKYIWTGNNMTITNLPPIGDKNEVEKFSEFLQTSTKGEEIYNKIKSLTKADKKVTA